MPDWSIQNYKTTPDSNAAINGVDISDATGLPGSLNDALRQVMADVAASSLLHPELLISADPGNALEIGEDGLLWADPADVAGGTPALYISADEGNKASVGSDGLIFVSKDAVSSKPWDKITGKPASFTPLNHAATHGEGGSDVIPTFFPSGAVAMWYGAASDVPDGWIVCDGFGGAPDLAGRFPLGAGLSYLPNQSGGAVSSSSQEYRTGYTTPIGAGAHTHRFYTNSGTTTGSDLRLYAGQAPAYGTVTTSESGGGSHNHTFVLSAGLPQYKALYHIMKT